MTPSQDPAEQPSSISEYVVLESGLQSPTPSSPSKASSATGRKEAYSALVQKVQNWSVANYHHCPEKRIQHVSMTPSIFKVTISIDESKGLMGTGIGSSLKAAERQAFESLEKIIQFFEESKNNKEECPIKDPSSYKSFEDDKDESQPWFKMVKQYVDSISIMHTRQPSHLEECIEWDKRFWVILKIECQPPLVGKGVHVNKKKAINLAAIVVAYQLDNRVDQNPAKPIEPTPLAEYSDYIVKEPDECLGLAWLPSAKTMVHRIFSKCLKREPLFDVKAIDNVKPVRYLAQITYDEATCGKGQGMSSKDATRLASVDLCFKLWKINPQLLDLPLPISTPNKPKAEEPIPDKPANQVANNSPKKKETNSPSKPNAVNDTKVEKSMQKSTEDIGDWKTRPKFAIHEIFLSDTGRTPQYKLEESDRNGTFSSTVRYEKDKLVIIGRGQGPNASQASFNAALDFCKKYFSRMSLGEKRASDEENAPKAKSLKSGKELNVKVELLRPISINAEFALFVFQRHNLIANMKISNRGPSHKLVWICCIPIRINSKLIEGKAESSTKNSAILAAVNELARHLRNYDGSLYELFLDTKKPHQHQQPDTGRDIEMVDHISKSLTVIRQPEIPLVVSTDDRNALLLVCDPRKLNLFENCVLEQRQEIVANSQRPSVPLQTPSPEFLVQKSHALAERQTAFLSSGPGREVINRRHSCPSNMIREPILHALTRSNVVIVDGAVGCGMSSQIPLLILENMISKNVGVSCNILVVVTSNVEAVALADHLAHQRGSKLGQEIGYRIGEIDDCEPELYGCILFTTFSYFLRTAKRNPFFVEFSHIILDDISARSLEVDISLLLAREAISHRPELRLLIYSKEDGRPLIGVLESYFSRFLKTVVPVPFDKSMNVKTSFLDEIVKLFEPSELEAICARESDSRLVLEGNKPKGVPYALLEAFIGKIAKSNELAVSKKGILVIVPTLNDALILKRTLSFGAALKPLEGRKVAIHMLHANMRHSELMAILAEPSNNSFDLIISTDLIETGFVSCLDMIMVVDCGLRVGPLAGSISTASASMDSQFQDCDFPGKLMVVDPISLQRRSRQSNQRHYVLTQRRLVEESVVECEAKRISLERLITRSLSLLGNQLMGFPNTTELILRLPEVLASASQIENAFAKLHEMSLCFANQRLLTELGEVVCRIPLEPNWGRFLVGCVLMRCLEAGLLICASVVVGSSPVIGLFNEDPLDIKKYSSDHYGIIIAFNRWQEARPRFLTHSSEQQFCQQNGLDLTCLRQMERVKNRLMDCLENDLRLLSGVAVIYAPDSPDLKQCLNANLEKRSILRGLLVYAMAENLAVGYGSSPLYSLQVGDTVVPIAEGSACLMTQVNHETGPGVFVFDRQDAGRAVLVSRVPAMAGALLGHTEQSDSGPIKMSHWTNYNSRDSKSLFIFRQVLHKAIGWLASAASLTSCSPTSSADNVKEATAYATKVIALAASLIRNHSYFEQ